MSHKNVKTSEENFENDVVCVKACKIPHSSVKLDIKVKPATTHNLYDSAEKNLRNSHDHNGKAKKDKDTESGEIKHLIQKQFLETALKIGFEQAVQLCHLPPLPSGKINSPTLHECSPDKGAHFTIEYETQPSIPLINPKDLTIPKVETPTITNELIEQNLHKVALENGTFTPVHNRGVREGDYVDLDITILSKPPRSVIENRRIEIKAGVLPSFLIRKIVNARSGTSIEGHTELGLNEKQAQFTSEPYRADIKAIWSLESPIIDDSFAKKLGFKSLQEFKSKIKKDLENQAMETVLQEKYNRLNQAIVSKYNVELPLTILNQERGEIIKNITQNYSKEKINDETTQEINKFAEDKAKQSLILSLLLQQYGREHKINISDDELKAQFMRQVGLMRMGRIEPQHPNSKDNYISHVMNLALHHKIQDTILDNVKWV